MKEVKETLYDDLLIHQSEGEQKVEAAETVAFTFDGQPLEIDLNEDNVAAFREIMQPFVEAARPAATPKSTGKRKAPAAAAPATGGVPKKVSPKAGGDDEASRIREWADKNGFDLSARGRIPQNVKDAYAQAMLGRAPGEVTHDSLTDEQPPAMNFTPVAENDSSDAAQAGADSQDAGVPEGASASEPEPQRV